MAVVVETTVPRQGPGRLGSAHRVNAFLQTLRSLGPLRLSVIGGVGVVVLAFFVFATIRMSTPTMAMLYGDLLDEDAVAITDQLTSQGIRFELRKQNTQIWIPEGDISSVRIELAREGLPKRGTVGYELFDNGEGFGTTSFMQNIRQLRALEGELARTITSIDAINQARVHLVLPRRELFARTEQEPSASIFLQLDSSDSLPRQVVLAVQNLVSAAVPRLKPSAVSVVDSQGQLLASGEEDEISLMNRNAEEMRINYERRVGRDLEALLQRVVGIGKVRAEVAAVMNFDRLEIASETFNPDEQVTRSTQRISEETESTEAEAIDSITVANQLPSADAAGIEPLFPTARQRSSRTEETVNNEISKTVTTQVREAGVVERVSVAVLVDGSYQTGEDGTLNYQPRTEAEMTQLLQLVRRAVGYDADRGDTVEVINMQFIDEFGALEEEELLFGIPRDDVFRIAEILTLGIVAILIILLVIRPLLTRAFDTDQEDDDDDEFLEDEEDVQQLPTGGALAQALAMEGDVEEEEDMDAMIDVSRIEGKVRASTLRKIGEIIDKHPEEAVGILRSWMYREA
jgi:flagellar M-ring protein FliF